MYINDIFPSSSPHGSTRYHLDRPKEIDGPGLRSPNGRQSPLPLRRADPMELPICQAYQLEKDDRMLSGFPEVKEFLNISSWPVPFKRMFLSSEATATKNRLETNFWREISGPGPDLLDESRVLMNYKLRKSMAPPLSQRFICPALPLKVRCPSKYFSNPRCLIG